MVRTWWYEFNTLLTIILFTCLVDERCIACYTRFPVHWIDISVIKKPTKLNLWVALLWAALKTSQLRKLTMGDMYSIILLWRMTAFHSLSFQSMHLVGFLLSRVFRSIIEGATDLFTETWTQVNKWTCEEEYVNI